MLKKYLKFSVWLSIPIVWLLQAYFNAGIEVILGWCIGVIAGGAVGWSAPKWVK